MLFITMIQYPVESQTTAPRVSSEAREFNTTKSTPPFNSLAVLVFVFKMGAIMGKQNKLYIYL